MPDSNRPTTNDRIRNVSHDEFGPAPGAKSILSSVTVTKYGSLFLCHVVTSAGIPGSLLIEKAGYTLRAIFHPPSPVKGTAVMPGSYSQLYPLKKSKN